MISKQDIENIINKQIVIDDMFIVDITVKPGNAIMVNIDSPEGVNVKDCTSISRLIENSFDRETEDFSIQVSSPGLDQPLKVKEQYLKNIGREVQIVKTTGEKYKGKLILVESNFIEIEYSEKVKVEGKKKKQIIVNKQKLNFGEIKTTKIVIAFK